MKTLKSFLESSNPRIPRKKDNPLNPKNILIFTPMKIRKEPFMV